MSKRLLLAAVTGVLFTAAGQARADAIDGHWCDNGNRHLEIDGPSIVTPSGVRLKGDYNRHGFTYVEPKDGKTIVMVLYGETIMRLRAGEGPEETWRRCAAPTS